MRGFRSYSPVCRARGRPTARAFTVLYPLCAKASLAMPTGAPLGTLRDSAQGCLPLERVRPCCLRGTCIPGGRRAIGVKMFS